MSAAWNVEEEKAKVIVGGAEYDVECGEDLIEMVEKYSREAGYKKVRVFLNGEEISDKSTAPSEISAGDTIKLEPYDTVGL